MAAEKNDQTLKLLTDSFKNPYTGKNLERIRMGLSLISRPTASQRNHILVCLEQARAMGEPNDPRKMEFDKMIDCAIETWWPEEKE